MDTIVEHRAAQNRFVLPMPEGEAKLAYRMLSPTIMDLTSTFVPSAARGRGTGAQLAEAALVYARAQGLQVIPTCWYVGEYIEKHPEFAVLLEPALGKPDRTGASCDLG